jgi:hypothetical protein
MQVLFTPELVARAPTRGAAGGGSALVPAADA